MSETGGIEVIGNKIFFHTEVNDDTIFEFVKRLHEMEHMREIVIFIKSDGGDLYSGLCALDHMLISPAYVTTVADGLCASAASIMLFGGRKRFMMENAHILIHQISSEFSGKYEEFKTEKKHLTRLMGRMREIYRRKTRIPDDRLEKYMKKDTILSSEKCIRYGIVEGVYSSSSNSSS
jgi:ATP-dependent Clp endopeptidase proteolytic subunit ClpP